MHRLVFPAFTCQLQLSVLAVLSCASLAAAAPVAFNIPAQIAADALTTFSKQSGIDVLFPSKELKMVRSQAVVGRFEPDEAIAMLLKDTGYVAARDGRKFVVKSLAVGVTTGSVRGSLTGEGGKGVAKVLVTIKETGQSVETDRYGEYVFPSVAAGPYVLVAIASGYQPMHITDVVVHAGRELTLGRKEMRMSPGDVTVLEPFVVHADTVTELVEVTGSKEKPFSGANVDLPRSINDVQPYYIFDAKSIDETGAVNIEAFLKQNLTQNGSITTNSQTVSFQGNHSEVNLRGLGTNKTLILVNGRRRAIPATSQHAVSSDQPDLNDIPLSAIDHIEVLPTSASGIYGGSAIGGVVNVVLKKDYTGGELRLGYTNTTDSDMGGRSVSLAYGLALEGGRTHLTINAAYADQNELEAGDRERLIGGYISAIYHNSPGFISSSTSPFLGSLPNVISGTGGDLILKNGQSLGSPFTYVPAGTSSNTPMATLIAGLLANAGLFNLALPPTAQSPTGLRRSLVVAPATKSLMLSADRQMFSKLELFVDLSRNATNTVNAYSDLFPATFPVFGGLGAYNPFAGTVYVSTPTDFSPPISTSLVDYTATVGLKAELPHGWQAEADYSWSRTRYDFLYYGPDPGAVLQDFFLGGINPFVDTLANPLPLQKYLSPTSWSGVSTLTDIALRASGPVVALPWGTPGLTIGLEHRIEASPENTNAVINTSVSSSISAITTVFSHRLLTDSAYLEALVPLVAEHRLPLLHSLDLELAGRAERYTVDSGTPSKSTNLSTGTVTNNAPTKPDGTPFFAKTTYTSSNGTAGFKYQPVDTITVRLSYGTAFLPPTPAQLVANPASDAGFSNVTDPKTGTLVSVQTISGGNPNLIPENSRSWNAGFIWEPKRGALSGLRLNAEYYRIYQYDAINTLSAQQIVDNEAIYPSRVTRNSSGAIILVDTSSLNLYRRESEGWDFSGSYDFKTPIGLFHARFAESIVLHIKNQISLTEPVYEYVDVPSEGGAVRYNSSANLSWDIRNWTLGWAAHYIGSYKQSGAAGSPSALQTGVIGTSGYVAAQGSETIPSQIYQDVFFTYKFGAVSSAGKRGWATLGSRFLDGLSISAGVKDVFNRAPPLDVAYNFYASPYGDLRLRSFWVSAKKVF